MIGVRSRRQQIWFGQDDGREYIGKPNRQGICTLNNPVVYNSPDNLFVRYKSGSTSEVISYEEAANTLKRSCKNTLAHGERERLDDLGGYTSPSSLETATATTRRPPTAAQQWFVSGGSTPSELIERRRQKLVQQHQKRQQATRSGGSDSNNVDVDDDDDDEYDEGTAAARSSDAVEFPTFLAPPSTSSSSSSSSLSSSSSSSVKAYDMEVNSNYQFEKLHEMLDEVEPMIIEMDAFLRKQAKAIRDKIEYRQFPPLNFHDQARLVQDLGNLPRHALEEAKLLIVDLHPELAHEDEVGIMAIGNRCKHRLRKLIEPHTQKYAFEKRREQERARRSLNRRRRRKKTTTQQCPSSAPHSAASGDKYDSCTSPSSSSGSSSSSDDFD